MDGPSLLPLMIMVGAFLFAVPRVASAVGATSDLLGQLFVPPDRALPWPHGVQESDEPWGWRPAPLPRFAGPDDGHDSDDDGPAMFEVDDLVLGDLGRRGGLIVELAPVPSNRPHRAAA